MQKSNPRPNQRNIHAILQQRRLRHINGICIRNLAVPPSLLQPEGNGVDGNAKPYQTKTTPKLYFIIQSSPTREHANLKASVIYESEHVECSTNPTWVYLEIKKSALTASNNFSLQLWGEQAKGKNPQVILQWKFPLSGLAYIAEHLHFEDLTFSPNALVVKINTSFYALPQTFSTNSPHGNCPNFNVDEEKVSCNVFSLKRIVTCHASIKCAEGRSSEFVAAVEKLMEMKRSKLARVRQIEDLRAKISRLRKLLQRETKLLKTEHSSLMSLKTETAKSKRNLTEKKNNLSYEEDQQADGDNHLKVYCKRTSSFKGQLNLRRMEVLSELAYIFPISPHVPEYSGKNSSAKLAQKASALPCYTICDIFLPDAEHLNPKEDAKNAIAMGYVSQMVSMISHFLSIPLTYQLRLMGSQSSIEDHVTEKLQENERYFPLFSKNNKERFLFQYAVYLLNKNIGQMLFQLDRSPRDLRPTLHNLKMLLEFGRRSGIQELPVRNSPLQPIMRVPTEKQELKTSISNGVTSQPVDMVEKLQDKTAELHSLRGELFAGTKKAKSIPVSPKRTAADANKKPVTQPSNIHLSVPPPEKYLGMASDDLSVMSSQNGDSAVLLTGLEDLDKQNSKNHPQKSFDVVAARNELFSTKGGRNVYSRKNVYSAKTNSSHAMNYFSTKEQLFRKDSSPSTKMSSSGTNGVKEGAEGKSESNFQIKTITRSMENNNLKSAANDAPLAVAEDFDLC